MTPERPLARSLEDLRPLHQLCREGRLYEVERWITDGKPLQLAPDAIHKSARPKTALEIALETGQHSLVSVLLKSPYRLELERYRPLDLALQERRWDLFDLLLEAGGVAHLRAALALWDYAERSARRIFGRRLGMPLADVLLEALRARGPLTATAISGLFGRHRTAEELHQALGLLRELGLAAASVEATGGRSATLWAVCEGRETDERSQ